MVLDQEIYDLFRLNKNEAKVFSALSDAPKRPSVIVRETDLPNATAYLAFSTLQKRGLAERRKVGGSGRWLRAPLSSLEHLLAQTINNLEHLKKASMFEIQHREDTSVIVHRGDEAMRKVLERVLDMNALERFTIFQGALIDDGWSRVVGLPKILKINEALGKKKIIGESFIPEDYFTKLIPFWGKKWAQSYVDRLNIVYLLPSEFFESRAEIIVLRDRVFIFHINGEIAVEIKNEQMLMMFKMLFEYLKTVAHKVDPQEFLKTSLTNLPTK